MMKRINLYVLLLLSVPVWAAERSVEQAAALASEFMNQQVLAPQRKAAQSAQSFTLTHTRQKLQGDAPAYYVFNHTGAGFVVVSADDRTEDVLMYSEEGELDMASANPNVLFWLGRLQEEISAVNDDNALDKTARTATQDEVTAIAPLLVNDKGQEIKWDQESPYWNKCPKVNSTYCLTGCVATAAAQVMYKWRYPETGTGSHSYTTDTKKISLSQDFSQVTFDWANMRATYSSSATTAQKNAVATLMYCCGVACDMDYNTSAAGGSAAYTDYMARGLVDYLGYKVEKFITMYSKSGYGTAKFSPAEYSVSLTKFKQYFNAELEAGRPIVMGGGSTADGGHEFVCDGRDASGKFHINWGWSGANNCYCALNALKPEGTTYDFSSGLDAIIGLQPGKIDTVYVTGVSVAPTTLTLKQREKATLTATIAPEKATVKDVIWSSSNDQVAVVTQAGVVSGVSKGTATITATSREGGKKATCAVTVSDEVIEAEDCAHYAYTLKGCKVGENELGDYTWTIALDAGSVKDVDNTRGQQFGSSTTPCGQVSLKTANVEDCLVQQVVVNACMAKDGDAQLSVYVDGVQIGSTQKLTTTPTEYTFLNTASVQGELEVRLTNTKKAMYVKTLEVNPAASALATVAAERSVGSKVLLDGQLYILHDGHLYNAQGSLVH